MRGARLIAGLVTLAFVAGACGGNDGAPSSTPTSTSAPGCDAATATDESDLPVATVVMTDLMYLPGCFIARNGDQVLRLENADPTPHTFTVNGTDVDVEVPAGTTVKAEGDVALAVLAPGTYPFHCRIHSSMTGVVIVR